jgi:hypothetical protein
MRAGPSISEKLATLPSDTVVYTGHRESTTIGDETVHYDEWVTRSRNTIGWLRVIRCAAGLSGGLR